MDINKLQLFQQSGHPSWEEYKAIKNCYGHVASFGYYPERKKHKPGRNQTLIADSNDEYEIKLKPHLNKKIVFLGLNTGLREDERYESRADGEPITTAKINEIVAKNKKIGLFDNQYGSDDSGRYWDLFKGYAASQEPRDTLRQDYNKPNVFDGAYLTDFLKFERNDSDFKASGLSTKTGNELTKLLKIDGLIEHNVKGLQHELAILGEPNPTAIVMLGSHFSSRHFDEYIANAFPNTYVHQISHYKNTTGRVVQDELYELNDKLLDLLD